MLAAATFTLLAVRQNADLQLQSAIVPLQLDILQHFAVCMQRLPDVLLGSCHTGITYMLIIPAHICQMPPCVHLVSMMGSKDLSLLLLGPGFSDQRTHQDPFPCAARI